MKKTIIGIVLLFAVVNFMEAQSIYDAEKLTSKDLTGTARFVGMGGALGALGADISTMGVNPAGIGLYRKYDFSGTFNYTMNDQDVNYFGHNFEKTKRKSNMNSLGFVISTPVHGDILKYVNFGFNYTKAANFNTNLGMGNTAMPPGGFTIGNQMAAMANAMSTDASSKSKRPYDDHGWLGRLGYDGYLIDPNGADFGAHFNGGAQKSNFFHKETGGIDQYDFNVSLNLSNRVFLGFTVGVYNVNHNVKSSYGEYYNTVSVNTFDSEDNPIVGSNGEYIMENRDEWMAMTTETATEGNGFDLKFGTIFRPIESSPFRIGVAVHTPTFYRLTHYTNFYFDSDVVVELDNGLKSVAETGINTLDATTYGADNAFDYKLRTPWKLNLSLGHNIGTLLAIGAEYEYQDYSTTKFFYRDGSGDGIDYINNSENRGFLKKVHTVRLGGELKVIPEVAFRLGYNWEAASFDKTAYKFIHPDSPITDTAYFNKDGAKNTYTIGLGYMGSMWYADLAYKYDTRKNSFRPFDGEDLPMSTVKMNNSSVLFTLGVRL